MVEEVLYLMVARKQREQQTGAKVQSSRTCLPMICFLQQVEIMVKCSLCMVGQSCQIYESLAK
jgi:hypothetical protein